MKLLYLIKYGSGIFHLTGNGAKSLLRGKLCRKEQPEENFCCCWNMLYFAINIWSHSTYIHTNTLDWFENCWFPLLRLSLIKEKVRHVGVFRLKIESLPLENAPKFESNHLAKRAKNTLKCWFLPYTCHSFMWCRYKVATHKHTKWFCWYLFKQPGTARHKLVPINAVSFKQ